MKIAFSGASGTGKTTLAKYMSEALELPFNPVGARSVAKAMGFDNPYDVDKASLIEYKSWLSDNPVGQETAQDQLKGAAKWAMKHSNFVPGEPTCRSLFQAKLQQDKIDWELAHPDGYVSDRTTVDDMAYLSLHNVHGVTLPYLVRADQHLQQYDLVFYCRVESFHDIGDDPNRMSSAAYHDVHQLLLEGTLISWLGDDWNELVHQVDAGDLVERKAEVLAAYRNRATWLANYNKRKDT